VARAGERATYLNIGPGATTPAPPSPPASGGSSGLSNRAADTNGRSGSSFCQQPVYDNWGNVTGYRQGGC